VRTLRKYWENLNPRERWLVGGGAAVVVLLFLYTLVWDPWQRSLEQLRTGVPAKQATLQWMRAQARS
jgi:general secretion pathway protein M